MAAFGTVFMPQMIQARFADNSWSESALVPSDKIELHAGAHVLHYSSTCFEGLKAFRHEDGSVYIFRMDANIARMKQSSKLLNLPDFDESMLEQMIKDIVKEYADETPTPPGSMYIRPTHIGTEAAIGKAAAPSMSSLLYVLLSPVGDYFSGGATALRVLLEEDGMRCAPHMGMVKSGGNYASALGPILEARSEHQADQILFCPGGDVQETGAANFILIDGDEIITKALDAKDLGMTVSERNFTVSELLERAAKPGTEAALSGTAAVLTSVGTLIHNDQEFKVGSGEPGEKVAKLRQALNDIQWGKSADTHGWLTKV
jgi:branched-chain amino acid aminotransferase